jgi:hypothetical protein
LEGKFAVKLKVFLWDLKRGVVLTKDNLKKRRWKGDTKCVFVVSKKQYNIFFRHTAKFIWNSLFTIFKFQLPSGMTHLFGPWTKIRSQVIVGVVAMCRAIWLSRNDTVFNKAITKSFV